MTEKEFVEWFKGFSEGVHHYNLTPAQWDLVKERLTLVGNQTKSSYIINREYWTTTVC